MCVVIFWEEHFPFIDTEPIEQGVFLDALAGEDVLLAGMDELEAALADDALLVLPYGSAFPKACWPVIAAFLRRGGRWLHLGGAPLTRPVRRTAQGWQVEGEQHAYGQEVMIRYTFPVRTAGARVRVCAPLAPEALAELAPEEVWALQVLLTHHQIDAGACGSSGPREGVLTPLSQLIAGNDVLAAPAVAIDHPGGGFLGGRWVLAPCRTAFSPAVIRALAAYARQPVLELSVRPGFACYQPGEHPTLTLRAACPRPTALTIHLSLRAEESADFIYTEVVNVTTGIADAYFETPPLPITAPGLYLAHAEAVIDGQARPVAIADNGLWIYDANLLAHTAPLSVTADYFQRNGQPYPITGTTYMSTVAHRLWLFEPSVAAWEQDFAAMRRAGVNMVRTGIWMGWKHAAIESGALAESVVRALQAFLLTAARHDMPVIFTVFAFLPESWGGTHPYLDPVAVRAQCAFLAALSGRMAAMPHLLWDFINEPSFAHVDHLWSVQPVNDRHEQAAWAAWLRAQAGEDEWRERWRLTPNDALGLPVATDFQDGHNLDGKKPLRARDYVRFGQEMFARWATTMREVIRANGNPHQLVTVGQDEGGSMFGSPCPLWHAGSVDFTSNHSWWQNDDLLWDSVMTKTQARPNMMEETGIMFAERQDTMPWRSLEMVRGLLERKAALSFACGSAGFIQWLWNTCVYNDADNEAGIGLLRADGSAKPELRALRGVARFMAANAGQLTDRRPERAVMIVPHSYLFSVSPNADLATRRCVRTLEYRLGVPCRAVGEYQMTDLDDAALLILPSPRILREECWRALLARVAAGATLLVSGVITADEYWRETPRLAPFGVLPTSRPVFHEEIITVPGAAAPLSVCFPLPDLQGMLDRAVAADGSALDCAVFTHGAGRILYCPLPIEHALAESDTEAVYRHAVTLAGLPVGKTDGGPGFLLRPVIFARTTLLLAVNESGIEQSATLDSALITGVPRQWSASLSAPAGGANLAFIENATGAVIAEYQRE